MTRVREILPRMGLDRTSSTATRELSGGQNRVGIARAMIRRRSVIW